MQIISKNIEYSIQCYTIQLLLIFEGIQDIYYMIMPCVVQIDEVLPMNSIVNVTEREIDWWTREHLFLYNGFMGTLYIDISDMA